MATAQEILAKIKESKRKENENLFRMVKMVAIGTVIIFLLLQLMVVYIDYIA